MKWGIALSDSTPENIRIFDATIRDGEQTRGTSLTSEEKLRVAESLDNLGADVIEAGSAAASNGEGVRKEVYGFAIGVNQDIVTTSIEAMLSGVNVLMIDYNGLQSTEVS